MDDLISRDFIKSLGGECIAARDSKTHELLPISSIDALPSTQPEKRTEERTETHACDTISKAIDKLRRRKALFCKNQIEFKLLPTNDKSRVDEIDACIAMLINMLPADVQPVTFCKNCQLRADVKDVNTGELYHTCGVLGFVIPDGFACNQGKRKGADNEVN